MKPSRKLAAVSVAALILLSGGAAGLHQVQHNHDVKQQSKVQADQTAAQQKREHISYQGVTGQTALAILQSSHQVGVKHYDFGDLVESIDGLEGTGPKYWSFYVNGKLSDTGASNYQTKASDTIEWKLE